MADSSVNSPRRMLSLSKERATVSLSDLDSEEKVEEHGMKPSEVYGFVGSITTIIATAIFFTWAYVPEPWLHYMGITYYPSRFYSQSSQRVSTPLLKLFGAIFKFVKTLAGLEMLLVSFVVDAILEKTTYIDLTICTSERYWALAVPAYVIITVVLAISFYIGLNFIATPSPTSLNTIYDEYSRDPVTGRTDAEGDRPIEPISDIAIDQINDLMFGSTSLQEQEKKKECT